MNTPHPATVPIAPALADLAFASASDSQVSRSLAWSSPGELGIDLSDPAQRRFGDYELLELIGQGGMGAVYRARQHNLDREVALKFLAAGPWASDEFIARFRREAQAAARMQHPNIVEIYDTGVRDGLYYFSMRLVKGETLSERLRSKGPMPVKQAAAMMRTIAEAIDYAHRLGVLHLDLKPGNVLLGEHDEPLVADFGLARRIDEGPSEHDNISGTPSYMAPEQATAKSSGIGPAADIYGLGAILYEMLVGEPPFRGRDVKDTLQHVLHDDPVAPKSKRHDVPADLDAICLKCLAKEPAQRYASARALANDLGRFLEGTHVQARAANWLERLRRWVERNQWQTVAYIVFAGGLVISTNEMRSAMRARESAEAHRAVAEQASQRSERMSALFAQAFVRPETQGSREAMEESAKRIVQWLDTHLAGDDQGQEEVLRDLITALRQANNPEGASALLWPIVEIMGDDYRRAVIDAHLAGGSTRGKLLALGLLRGRDAPQEEIDRKFALLNELAVEVPDDLLFVTAVAFHCADNLSACAGNAPFQRLAELEPDNGANWLYLLNPEEPNQVKQLLAKAASSSRFDDHFARLYALAPQAFVESELPIPSVLRSMIEHLADSVSAEDALGWYNTWSLPIPSWQPFVQACKPDGPAATDKDIRSQCVELAQRAMASDKHFIVTAMIGSTILRHLLPGTEQAMRAREFRRSYLYTYERLGSMTPEQELASRSMLMARETLQFGELEAAKRALDRAGVPRDPPPEWAPADPAQLMTGLERELYRARVAELAREPMLAPLESNPAR